jgi:hypothetical protein
MLSGKSLFWFSLCIDEIIELLLWENVGLLERTYQNTYCKIFVNIRMARRISLRGCHGETKIQFCLMLKKDNSIQI